MADRISSTAPEMRLLLTRPQPDADRSAARLRSLGHEVLLQPVLRTEFLPAPASIGDVAAIAVTSRNGLRALAAWPNGDRWRACPVFAVGDATAALAGELGFGNVRSAAGDGAALAELVASSVEPAAGPILYPAADQRSPVLEATLRQAGFTVTTIVAYRMAEADSLSPVIAEALSLGTIDGILLYSPLSARAFRNLVSGQGLIHALARSTVYAISEATALVLAGDVTHPVRVAARPDEDAMLELIASDPSGPAN